MKSDPSYLSPTPNGSLLWGDLTEGVLIRRYKRFLADVELSDGQVITAHTANTGAMTGCSEPGRPVWLSPHDAPGRKYKYTLEMIRMPDALVGVNTAVPNRLVKAAILAGAVPELRGYNKVRSEVRHGDSRLDLFLEGPGKVDAFVEIKNCTLVESGTALFPDAATVRGARHLEELARIVQGGGRAVVFVLVQRGDAERFAPADHIDPVWGNLLRQVTAKGVELLSYRADLSTRQIAIGTRLPTILDSL